MHAQSELPERHSLAKCLVKVHGGIGVNIDGNMESNKVHEGSVVNTMCISSLHEPVKI